jgi:hypothetical protein
MRPGAAGDLARVDARVQAADVRRPRVQEHHDLLERGVAGPLSDAVDRALDLPGAGLHAGEGVRHGQAEVVVAVDAQLDVRQARHQLVQAPEERRVLAGHRVPDRVGDVDDGRALLEDDAQDLCGEVHVGASGVHRGELDVVAQRARLRDRRAGQALDVLPRGHELVLDVDVRRRQERVDARARAVAHRLGGALDVGGMSAREAGDHRALDLARDRAHRLEVAGRGDREAGLDHVDAQAGELVRDLELLRRVQRDPGDCSPSRRVVSKMMTRSGSMVCSFVRLGCPSPLVCGFAAATRYSPRRGRRRARCRCRAIFGAHSTGRPGA